MGNLVVSIIIVAILAAAISKIVIEKKRGTKCMGCPHSKKCSH